MRRLLIVSIMTLLCSVGKAQFQGLVVNEFSQGNIGNREYIEILVVGARTCTDSTADIRGWIVDDQNSWYGSTNSTPGHYRFKNHLNWAAVPFGSIILLYNSADKNTSIHLPDDPTDANGDLSYIVPIASPYIEQYASIPSNASGPGYMYPGAATTAGYVASTNQWPFYVALNNTNGDVISLVSPANRSAAYFSIGYGYTITGGFQNPTVSIPNVGAGRNAYLNGAHYVNPSQWIISAVPSNETPGLPNGGANTTWIQSMQLGRPKVMAGTSALAVCFSNAAQTTFLEYSWTDHSPSHYSITWNSMPANNFIAVTNAVLSASPVSINIPAGTQPGTYTGSLTVSNVTGTSCTSVPFTVTVNAKPTVTVSPGSVTVCPNGGGVVLTANGAASYSWAPSTGLSGTAGNHVTVNPSFNTTYTVTGTDANGCSDTALSHVIVSPPPSNEWVQLTGCDVVGYSGTTYTRDTVFIETIPYSTSLCDSVIRTISIAVFPKPAITISPNKTICRGDTVLLTAHATDASVLWQGIGAGHTVKVAPNATTTYTAIATASSGCTNAASVTVMVNSFDVQLVATPNPVIAGTSVQLQTSATASYGVLSWQPLLGNATALKQTMLADTSVVVKVTAQSAEGCVDYDSVHVMVDPLNDVFIPTAFTPNKDGRNDVFTIAGENFKSFDLKVYNRWGQMVFYSQERSRGWNGTFKGKEQPSGVYVFVLKATLKNGKIINRTGTITLLK